VSRDRGTPLLGGKAGLNKGEKRRGGETRSPVEKDSEDGNHHDARKGNQRTYD